MTPLSAILEHMDTDRPRHALAIRMRVEDSASFREIAEELNVCIPRARQIYLHGLAIMRYRAAHYKEP